jgi:putative ABC transport system permease protein
MRTGRVTGMGAAATIALAVLTGACVLAATAGPREAQATSTRSLAQTLAQLPATDKTIAASSPMNMITQDIASTYPQEVTGYLTPAALGTITTQLRGDFTKGVLRMGPLSQDWMALTAAPAPVLTSLPALKGTPAKVEITYRYPQTSHMRLVSGSLGTPLPADDEELFEAPPSRGPKVVQVVVTAQTATTFGLHAGSRVQVTSAPSQQTGDTSTITLDVTGIVRPTDPAGSFWAADPVPAAPQLVKPQRAVPFWVGGFIADPDQALVLQEFFSGPGMSAQWQLPVDTSTVAGQAKALHDTLAKVVNGSPAINGELAPAGEALTSSSGLIGPLAAYVRAGQSLSLLLWILSVSLGIAAIVVLLLAARMVAIRREAELAVTRARGASLPQVFSLTAAGAATACVPTAAVAWLVSLLLIPNVSGLGPAAWWPGLAVLVVAIIAPGAVAAWRHRLPRKRQATRQARRAVRRGGRLVAEATAGAAAIVGLTVFRNQAPQPGQGIDLFTSAAPVLVAIPAVIVVLRLYPLVLRLLAGVSARRRGITGFLALRQAAQSATGLALPALTIVLALTVASFTGMVRDAVLTAETLASWQATGGDVTIATTGTVSVSTGVPASDVRQVVAVPGVRHAAAASVIPWGVYGGDLVTGVAVDPASYAALVASEQGFSDFNPALLATSGGSGATVPVLASPQAVAELGRPGTVSTLTGQDDMVTTRVRIVGEVSSTPALPSGGAFVILPVRALHDLLGPPPVNLIMLNGSSIDMTRLAAAVKEHVPGAPSVTTRSSALAGLTGTPLQQGAFTIFTVAVVFAIGLSLAVLLLELALGAAERRQTLARLATMGLVEGQRVRLVVLEVLPAVIASAVATVACALVLPRLLAPSIDLSVFLPSGSVPLRPQITSVVLPLAGLVVVTVLALAIEVRSERGRGVAATMRT